jgi:uncharacterized protein (TIGR03435 family)
MRLNFGWAFLLALASTTLCPTQAIAQIVVSPGTAAIPGNPPKAPSFDVVSIRARECKPGVFAHTMFTPDGFTSTNTPLYVVLIVAYELRDPTLFGIQPGGHLSRIPGAPEWTYSDCYDIQAKMADSDIAELNTFGREQRAARLQLMLQALLADRFNLTVHNETKDVPAFDLVVVSRGPKNMKKESDSEPPTLAWQGRAHLAAHALPFTDLANPILTGRMGSPVADKTGLIGKYDFTLDWSPETANGAGRESDNTPAPMPSGPSIFTALQEQLGLKLKPTKVPMESIVIDHIERPSEN